MNYLGVIQTCIKSHTPLFLSVCVTASNIAFVFFIFYFYKAILSHCICILSYSSSSVIVGVGKASIPTS